MEAPNKDGQYDSILSITEDRNLQISLISPAEATFLVAFSRALFQESMNKMLTRCKPQENVGLLHSEKGRKGGNLINPQHSYRLSEK